MKALFATLTIAALVAPLAAAGAGPFVYNGAMNSAYTGYAVTGTDEFTLDLQPGDTLDVTLEWDTADDLDLSIAAPGGTCGIYPELEADCLANSVMGRTECGGTYEPFLGTSPVTRSITAETAGTYKVLVQAGLVTPLTDVPYTLTIAVNGDGGADLVQGPTFSNYVNTGIACRAIA